MAEEKQSGRSQSFSKLLRGGSGGNEPAKEASRPLVLHGDSLTKSPEVKEKKRLLNLPFLKGAEKDAALAIGYREWTFLLGAILLFFGGLALVRYLAPKDGPLTAAFEIAPVDIDEGSRPPTEGEPTDEIVSSANNLRDTTRLVQPVPGMGKTKDVSKAAKTSGGKLKDSFWNGIKRAEKGASRAPRLASLRGAFNALLGRGGSAGAPHVRTMSPKEIADRLQGVSAGPSRGKRGQQLSYSGAQSVPGAARVRRSKYSSSGDEFNKARNEARKKLNNLYGTPEQASAQVASKFGESTEGGAQGGSGANTGGETPSIPSQEADNVDYKLSRDPKDMAQFNYDLKQREKMWDKTWGPFIDSLVNTGLGGCAAPTVTRLVNGGDAATNLDALGCDVSIYDQIIGVSAPRLVSEQGGQWCHIDITGTYKESTSGGDSDTDTQRRQSSYCRVPARAGNDPCGHIAVTSAPVPGDCSGLASMLGPIGRAPATLARYIGGAVGGGASGSGAGGNTASSESDPEPEFPIHDGTLE